MGGRHPDEGQSGGVAGRVLRSDHDGRGPVGPIDTHLLGHIVGGGSGQTGGAHEDKGLRGQIDVFLVLGDVTGDGLVTELGQLDAHLLGGDAIGSIPDDGPIASGQGEAAGRLPDLGAQGQRGDQVSGQVNQGGQHVLAHPIGLSSDVVIRLEGGRVAQLVGQGGSQQKPGRDLGVEGLGRSHRHLHVASVGGVEHPIGLVGEVGLPTVNDGQHPPAPGSDQIHRAVGVSGGAGLADGHGQRVRQVSPEPETGQLRGRQGHHLQAAAGGEGVQGQG